MPVLTGVAAVTTYFGIADKDWRKLSPEDKADLRKAVESISEDGTITGSGTY